MVLLELFSGIGGFSKGLQAAGYSFEKVYFSEIEKNAIANFKYNFPYAEHIGSVTEIGTAEIGHPDIITFGSRSRQLRLLFHDSLVCNMNITGLSVHQFTMNQTFAHD